MKRLLTELRRTFLRRHWSELRWSYANVGLRDLRPLAAYILGIDPDREEGNVARFEREFSEAVGAKHTITFSSGRVALRATLVAMNVKAGDHVVVPAYTCAVVPYAVTALGAHPRYVDIGNDYLIDPIALSLALEDEPKVVITQHTYGHRDYWNAETAKRAGVRVIEDSAHLVSKGIAGDAAFYSFDTTKPLTAGKGGAVSTNDDQLAHLIRTARDEESAAPSRWQNVSMAMRLLLSAFLYQPWVLPIGRWVHAGLARTGVLWKAITDEELEGRAPTIGRLTEGQAILLIRQLHRLPITNEFRSWASSVLYGVDPSEPLLRAPLQVRDKDAWVKFFAARQIELGQWFQSPLHPIGCNLEAAEYTPGQAPNAERLAQITINLPTSRGGGGLRRVKGAWRQADNRFGSGEAAPT